MPKDSEVAAALLRENHDLGNEICGLQDRATDIKEAGRLMFHAIMDRLCNGGTEADDGKGAERIDAALAAWAKIDTPMQKYYQLPQKEGSR